MNNLQLGNHLVAALDRGNSVMHELVHNSLGGFLLVDNSSALAHQERTELVKRVLIIIIALALGGLLVHNLIEISLVGDCALGGQLLHLSLAVLLPVADVVVGTHAHGTASEDDCADVIVMAGSADSIFVALGGTGLIGENEACTDPDGAGTHHQRSSEELTVGNTTGSNNLDRSAGEGGFVLGALLDAGGDEDGGGDVTSVTTTLATLSADNIDADVDALLDVLHVADHVHVDDAGSVEAVYNGLGGDTDSRDEELGTGLDDDVDELVEFALGVVVTEMAG